MQDQSSAETLERRAALRERLLDLAYDASSYLRRHQSALVRTSTALLLAASVAACSPTDRSAAVTPLSAEVRQGLPTQPGGYAVDPSTLARDPQGVYHFAWQPSGGGGWNQASASLLRLSEDKANSLEVPTSGDPILHLTPDTPVPLVESAEAARTPTTSSSTGGYSGYSWYPFYGGSGSSSPAYRNPSTTVSGGTSVQGSTASTTPPPPAARTSGLAHAVSGQSGGTGSGTAASGKTGAGASVGAASAKSSGFSGGGGSSSSASSS
jgi:hypothetical protein